MLTDALITYEPFKSESNLKRLVDPSPMDALDITLQQQLVHKYHGH